MKRGGMEIKGLGVQPDYRPGRAQWRSLVNDHHLTIGRSLPRSVGNRANDASREYKNPS